METLARPVDPQPCRRSWFELGTVVLMFGLPATLLEAGLTYRWHDLSDNESGFRVERSVDGIRFDVLATLPQDSTQYSDDTTVAGKRYWYRVAAFNAGGDSDFAVAMSAVAPGTTPTLPADPPDAPPDTPPVTPADTPPVTPPSDPVTPPPAAANTAPQISALADRTITMGVPVPAWTFTIGDAETVAENLTLIVGTSNDDLLPEDNARFGGTGATRTLTLTPRANVTGWSTVWVKVSDGVLDAVTSFVLVVAVADEQQVHGHLTNLSARGRTTSGDPLTVGFVVGGAAPKRMLVRAVGPTLAQAPYLVPRTLSNPRLRLLRLAAQGYSGYADNNDWGSSAAGAQIRQAASALAAFALDDSSQDAALLVDVPAGQYTAIVDDEANASGVVLAELYDADGGKGTRLVNVSTRGHVGIGGDALIAGFVVAGPGNVRVLVRAVGPAIAAAPFSVPGALADPVLELFRHDSSGDAISIFLQDNWTAQPDPEAVAAVAAAVGAFPLAANSKDAAALVTLGPGAYTAVVRGAGQTQGTGLVEVYDATED